MLKTFILTTLKVVIAAGLIAWLLSSGKLNFSLLKDLMAYPGAILLASTLAIFNFLLISFRWKNILIARSTSSIPVFGVFWVTWIGQFFSSVLPGSVSGDLVKLLYIQRYDSTFSKKFIFATILIDRIIGLAALILMVGLSSLLFSGHILENAPAMEPLLKINYMLSGLVILGIIVFILFPHFVEALFVRFEKIFLPAVWSKIGALWNDLVSIKKQLLQGLCVSFAVQFIGVLIFWSLIQPFVEGKMDFIQALAFIPLGVVTLALPVAPSGLGVGHAIFQKLFEFAGIDNGASLFNLFFVVTLAVNVLGVIPYLLTKSKRS